MTSPRSPPRGISPVVGGVLVIAVTVTVMTVLGVTVLEFTDSTSSGSSVGVDTHISHGNVEAQVSSGSAEKLTLLVNGTVEDVAYDVGVGDSLYAENVKPDSQVSVLSTNDGAEELVSTTRVLPEAGAPAHYETIGETGTVSVATSGETDWDTITFENTYSDPVLIMQPITHNGPQGAHVRIKSVNSTAAKVKVEEWNYLDDSHIEETIHYVVMEKGTHTLEDGTQVDVGERTQGSLTFKTQWFNTTFSSTPALFTQSQTHRGGDAVITRNKDINGSGFKVEMEEQELNDDSGHKKEDIGYIAVEQQRGLYRFKYEAGLRRYVNDDWTTIYFDNEYGETPNIILSHHTVNGPDTVNTRYRNLGPQTVEVRVQEDQSGDDETTHTYERLSYWVFDHDRDIVAINDSA